MCRQSQGLGLGRVAGQTSGVTMNNAPRDAAKMVGIEKMEERTSLLWKLSEKKGQDQTMILQDRSKTRVQESAALNSRGVEGSQRVLTDFVGMTRKNRVLEGVE